MTTYEPTAITTDRKDSDSSVQSELSYLRRHAVFRVTQSKLPRPITYDRKCGRLTTRFQPCSIIYALSTWRDRNELQRRRAVQEKTVFRPGLTQADMYSLSRRYLEEVGLYYLCSETKVLISCAITAQLICAFVFCTGKKLDFP